MSRSWTLRGKPAMLFFTDYPLKKESSGFCTFCLNFKMNLDGDILEDFRISLIFSERLDGLFNGDLPAVDVDSLSFKGIGNVGRSNGSKQLAGVTSFCINLE